MLQKKFKTTNYTDKHGYEEFGTQDIRGANGEGKTKTLLASLPDFRFFSANLSLLG
jgi:hypothetical protein